jgi:hypothetical protein
MVTSLAFGRHSGTCEARTRNLEIPGLVLTDHPGMTSVFVTKLTKLHL